MSGETTAQSPHSAASAFSLLMAWGIVLINLFVFGMAGFVLYQSHEEYEERSGIVAQNLSRMLALDMSREFEKIDTTLLVAADEITNQLRRGIDAARLNAFLRHLQGHVPEIISLRVTDANGIVRYGVGVDPKVRIDISDREYFLRQRDDPQAGLVVASPVMARIDKRWVVIFSHALCRTDGSFAGIVYANVSIDHLVQLLSSVEVGPRDSSSLRDTGLRIYARYPVPENVDKVYGKRLDVPELQKVIEDGLDAGSYVSSHTVDGVERKFAVRRVGKLPLYVVVGRAADEYMLPWREQAAKTLAVFLLFFVTSLVASWLIYRSWRSQVAATAELAREEEKFHTVADHTYDWEYWEGRQGEIRYMSPSCQRVTGYAQAEFVADPGLLQRIVHPGDQTLLAGHRHDIEHKDEAALDFRIVCRDGEIRWLAHVCQSVFGNDG
ncbi:MAG: PAS domain-containing protein, partial [Gammaproteobacteria bacterium]|nr:PAS domain-containing protein [Gammaproteobacteria bacterium]